MTRRLYYAVVSTLLVFGLIAEVPRSVRADQGDIKPEIFALIIGETAAPDRNTSALRFADDDALATYQLMVQLAPEDHVVVLTTPDAETRTLYPNTKTTPATREAIENARARLNERMRAAQQIGRHPVFYFFYTGHGDVKNNEGYVTISDGRFTRTDLMHLLKDSNAAKNHVIIDACKSYFMVQSRGKGTRRKVSGRLPIDDDSLPRNTGFFLSTSSDADSHEWEAFQGGIFSHEMRSALRGGADLDGNRTITYEEAAAFIWRANASIPAERFRPHFFSRPPDNAPAETSVLTDLNPAEGSWLSLKSLPSEHQYIEDGLGERLLDLHPASERIVAVLLPKQRPLFVRYPKLDKEISVPSGNVVDILDAAFSPHQVATRGAGHEAFSRLFALPFDTEAVLEYRKWKKEADLATVLPSNSSFDWTRRSLAIGGSVLLTAGAAMTGAGLGNHLSLDENSSGADIYDANQSIPALNIAAISCYAVGGVALTSYLIWTLIQRRRLSHRALLSGSNQRPAMNLNVSALPAGLTVGGAF
jgi:hypothetical protein